MDKWDEWVELYELDILGDQDELLEEWVELGILVELDDFGQFNELVELKELGDFDEFGELCESGDLVVRIKLELDELGVLGEYTNWMNWLI